ncbi:MAG: hypothetical protein E3J52_11100 [Promethearchaeota archaeon]|nr:MAG: hypothetical protein E3J52_11100 [Candidatus Lokiarchaeota archaeon]
MNTFREDVEELVAECGIYKEEAASIVLKADRFNYERKMYMKPYREICSELKQINITLKKIEKLKEK